MPPSIAAQTCLTSIVPDFSATWSGRTI
jgi:hypothetical protein